MNEPTVPARRPIRVMHLIEDLENGGAERLVVNLVQALDTEKFRAAVGCLTRKGRMAAEVERAGIPLHAMHKRPGVDFSLLVRLVRCMRRQRIDIVHCHVFTANLWGRIAAMLAGVPVLITHEHSSFTLDSSTRLRLERVLIRRTAKAITVSENLRQAFIEHGELPADRFETIHNGLRDQPAPSATRVEQIRHELQLDRFKQIVGTVGRLEWRKNYPLLLEAFAGVLPHHPEVGLLIVGSGPEAQRLEHKVRELRLSGNVVFAGHRSEVPALLAQMDVFCMSSLTEGISIAMLEAMAAGLPVVATQVGGNAEIIPDERFGLLVPSQNAGALGGALSRLLNQRELRREIGEHARKRVRQHFSERQMVRRLEELYLSLFDKSARNRPCNV